MRLRLGPLGLSMTMLAACSAAASPPMTPAAGQPFTSNPQTPSPLVRVAFTMHWPTTRTHVRGRRGVRWISPATTSVIVVIDDEPKYTTIANAPKHGSVSTIDIEAPAGRDEFQITLYDAPQKRNETAVQGNPVGEAVVSQKVAAAQTNVLKAAIAGIPSIVVAAPAPKQLVRENPAGGYFIIGEGAEQFVVTAEDADGNAIVPQPRLAMRAGGVAAQYYTVAAVKGNAQTFAVRAIAPNPGAQPAQLTVTASDDYGDNANNLIPVSELSILYVVYANSSTNAPAIAAYDGTGSPLALPSGAFAGLQDPRQVAYDSDHQRVYVADHANNGGQILAFDASGNPVASFKKTLVPGATGVVYDPNDRLLYAGGYSVNILGQATNTAAAYRPDGTAQPLAGQSANDETSALAYVPSEQYSYPYIAIGNAQRAHPSDPLLWLYREDFSLDVPAHELMALSGITDATGIATIDLAELIVCGTPASSGAANVFMEDREGVYISSLTVPNCQGVGYDPNSQEVYVTSGSANKIVAVQLNQGDVQLSGIDSRRTIQTPSSSGLSNPLHIAIAF